MLNRKMYMVWTDYIIIFVVGFFCLIGLIRGFISEVLSLVTWICAFFVTSNWYTYLSIWFTNFENKFVQNGIAIAILFIVSSVFGVAINFAISQLVKKVGLSGIDRVVGFFFGALQGMLVIAVILFFLDVFTEFSRSEDWKKSQLIPHFNFIIKLIFNYLQSSSNLLSRV